MERFALWLSALGVAVVFGACSAVLALMGVGVPFPLAALGVSALAGAALYAALRARLARQPPVPPAGTEPSAEARDGSVAEQVDAAMSTLRHDLRGVLSPALLVADRLVANPDPAVQRAGEVVVRSIDRATALIAKRDPAG